MQWVIMDINKSFGKLITSRRKEASLSQELVAEKLSISRSTLAKIELGESSPTLETIQQILEIFELKFCDLDDFFETQDLKTKVIDSLKSDSDREKILKQIKEL